MKVSTDGKSPENPRDDESSSRPPAALNVMEPKERLSLASFPLVRWSIAPFVYLLALRWGNQGIQGGNLWKCLEAMGLMFGGTTLIASELTDFVSAPLVHLFESIFYPDERGIPPVDFRLARIYRADGRYEDALEQYFHVLEYHPHELLAYLEGMETAFEGDMPAVARKLCKQGKRTLRSKVAREQVNRIFATLAAENR